MKTKSLVWLLALPMFFAGLAPLSARAIDRTIAKINDDIVTESDLAHVIAELRGEHRTAGIDAFAEATTLTVASMFDRELLMQEARRLHITPADEELHRQVEDMVREVRDNFVSDKEFYHVLAQEGLSLSQFKDQLLKQTREDFMVYHVVDSRFSVSDAEVAKYKQQDTEASPVKLRLRRLGIAITKKLDKQAACQKARAMVAKTITDGINFEEGVRRYSDVPGAERDGGEMGYMALDELSADVRCAVENLKVGQASVPVIAGDYANVFYLEGKRGAKMAVREQKFVEARAELLVSLRRRAILQVFDDRLVPLLSPEYFAVMEGRSGRAAAAKTPVPVANTSMAQTNNRERSVAPLPAAPRPSPSNQQILFAPTANQSQQVQYQPASQQNNQATPTPQSGYALQTQQPYQNIMNQPQPQPNQQQRRGWFGRRQ